MSLGDLSFDILVNNAGITRDMLALRMSESDWDSVLTINLKGSFFCCQQALRKMMRQKKSYIVNIASVVGLVSNSGQSNYAASKAGVVAVTKSLASEKIGDLDVLIIEYPISSTILENRLSSTETSIGSICFLLFGMR